MKTGIGLIAKERSRQTSEEGWTPGHDDTHRYGEIAICAAELAVYGTDACVFNPGEDPDRWGLVQKHKGDRIRCLEIAGALIAAELDREIRLRGLNQELDENENQVWQVQNRA